MRTTLCLLSAAILLACGVSGFGQDAAPNSAVPQPAAIVDGRVDGRVDGLVNGLQSPAPDRSLLYPPVHDALLGPGDLVRISVFGQGDYTPTVRLGSDGNALLPFLGFVHLAGLSVNSAEELLAQKLSSFGLYRDPQVTLQFLEGPSAVLTLSGEIHQVVPVFGSRRLLDVISAAGGFPTTASHIITINRPGVPQPLVIDLGTDPLRSEFANIPVFAGDTILVSRLGVVYVVGAFKAVGILPLTPYAPLTLIQATALSGGITFEGKYNDLRIIRTSGNTRTVVKVDIKRVLYGQAPDPILQAGDIVFLPSSPIKASLSNGTLGTLLGLAGIFISLER